MDCFTSRAGTHVKDALAGASVKSKSSVLGTSCQFHLRGALVDL